MPRFTPLEFLGQGATGQVWKALDATTSQHVALKMPTGDVQPVDLARFAQSYQAEATIMRTLSHPGILRLVDVGLEDGRPFIAYDYLQGQTLRALLSAGKTFTAPQAGMLLVAILEAVEYLHSLGIIHRDLNPNNIMILSDQQGGVRLLDFGAAAHQGAAPGPLIGTPQYMAPEQLEGGVPDPRSDLFSIAVIGYELLTGRPPFIGHSYPELVQTIGAGRFTPASQLKPDLPEGVDAFLSTALTTDPARRYQTAAAMRSVLLHALTGGTEAIPTPSVASFGDDFERPTMISGTPVRVDSAVLIAIEGAFAGRQFPLSGGITTLGGPYADIDLSRDLGIAAQHCWIIHEQDRYLLHDADDSGGTGLNGQYVKRAPLLEGDLIAIGESVFRFQDPHQPLGANRPQGSVEYARNPASPHRKSREQEAAAQVVASTQRNSGSDMAVWIILILLLFIIGGGASIGTFAVAAGVRNDMSIKLSPVWGKIEPVLSANSAPEFLAQAGKLDVDAQKAFLASLTPQYPTWMAWLPTVKSAVEEAQQMQRFVQLLNDAIGQALLQPVDQTEFSPTTVTTLVDTRQSISTLKFELSPWPLNQNMALSRLTKLTDFAPKPIDGEAAAHPLLRAIPKLADGLTALDGKDWARAFNLLDTALVTTDQWYRSASETDLKAQLTTELYSAGDVARTLMAVCEIRQAQIRVMHQPTDNLTPEDLATIKRWVKDADGLMRRVQLEDLRRILSGFRAGFPPGFDPRSLNDDIDAVDEKIAELQKAKATPISSSF